MVSRGSSSFALKQGLSGAADIGQLKPPPAGACPQKRAQPRLSPGGSGRRVERLKRDGEPNRRRRVESRARLKTKEQVVHQQMMGTRATDPTQPLLPLFYSSRSSPRIHQVRNRYTLRLC